MNTHTKWFLDKMERYISQCKIAHEQWPSKDEEWEEDPQIVMARIIGAYHAYLELIEEAVEQFKKEAFR